MGYINNTTLTIAGEHLLAKAETGTELKYTRIVVGDGMLPTGDDLLSRTQMVNSVLSVHITFCLPVFEGNTVAHVGGVFDNTEITTTFLYREVGLFAMDPDEGEILYAYGNAGTEAEPIAPAIDGGIFVERTVAIDAIIGRAPNITAAIAPGSNLSNYEFNQYKTEITNILAGKAEAGLPVEYELPLVSTVENTAGFRALYFKDPFERVTVSFHINKKKWKRFF